MRREREVEVVVMKMRRERRVVHLFIVQYWALLFHVGGEVEKGARRGIGTAGSGARTVDWNNLDERGRRLVL